MQAAPENTGKDEHMILSLLQKFEHHKTMGLGPSYSLSL